MCTVDLDKATYSILEGIGNSISSWCSRNGINKSLFSEWTNNVVKKTYDSMTPLVLVLAYRLLIIS